ncbi:MAG: twin-arginine translocase TatA/TatE family subunit, partial [Chloroflexales bacterium]
MEIFNVSIPELMLIAGLALVVFGPERLPEVGRFAGKQLAKLLAWQQNSPELQMLNEVRGEFEAEIASLRDELVRTRKQFDITKDFTAIRDELRPMLDLRGSASAATLPATA